MASKDGRLCGECTWLTVPVNGTSCTDKGITAASTPCKYFRGETHDLLNLKEASKDITDVSLFTWLPPNYSKAFMVCLGAGPWKFSRRQKVQRDALLWLNGRELENVDVQVDCYPLNWQNSTVNTLIDNLKSMKVSMHDFCRSIIRDAQTDSAKARRTFYTACGNPKGFKVLSLFCRDSLQIDSFPIDRHVQRRLEKFNLPVEENALVHLCNRACVSSRHVATLFVQEGEHGNGLDKGNPNWSDE